MKLMIIRHGEPDYDHDVLTEEGQRQALLLAERLCRIHIDRIYSSPMGRARQTALPFTEKAGARVTVLPWLHELEWGDLSGAPYSDGSPWELTDKMLLGRRAFSEVRSWRQSEEFSHSRVVDDIDKKAALLDSFLENEGFVRSGATYNCMNNNDQTIAFFCHGGIGCFAVSHLCGIPFPIVCLNMQFDFTGITELEFSSLKSSLPPKTVSPRIIRLNDTGHLSARASAYASACASACTGDR